MLPSTKEVIMAYRLDFDVLGPHSYKLNTPIVYYSPRYKKTVTVENGYVSDGSTGWLDMATRYWWVHDKLCVTMKWDDGTKCSRWQSSMVLGDLARQDHCWITGTVGVMFTWIAGVL